MKISDKQGDSEQVVEDVTFAYLSLEITKMRQHKRVLMRRIQERRNFIVEDERQLGAYDMRLEELANALNVLCSPDPQKKPPPQSVDHDGDS